MKIDVQEALRYLGIRQPDGGMLHAAEQAARQVEAWCAPRYAYRVCELSPQTDGVKLLQADMLLPGRLAGEMLRECRRAALLICTLGAEFDRNLRAAQARDMAKAVMLDACGSAYVEAGCDEAEKEIAARCPGLYLTDRFSPGYGDLPLAIQPPLLGALDAGRRLGVYAAPSLMLNPMKTVTAIIGLSDRPQGARIRGCAYCHMKNSCAYRKRGMRCAISE